MNSYSEANKYVPLYVEYLYS